MNSHSGSEAGGSSDCRSSDPYRIAIVGAGPSGCYTAQALRKAQPDVEVAVFDAGLTPYGLVRYGIAPDHQGSKAVTRQFDRIFAQPGVEFVGNVHIGSDLSVSQLLKAFHAVVVATGLGSDNRPKIDQDPRARVFGAGALVRLLNSDPDAALRASNLESLGSEIVILGTGNVAVDVARLLVKSDSDFIASDIDDEALRTVAPKPASSITILGRCDAAQAKWDASMLKELAEVSEVSLTVDGIPLLPENPDTSSRTTIDVRFQQVPDAIEYLNGRTVVRTHRSLDPAASSAVEADTVITALGCKPTKANEAIFGNLEHPRLFRVGGPATGRLGNLAENRKLAGEAAQEVLAALRQSNAHPRDGIGAIRHLLPTSTVNFDAWKRVDDAEIRQAGPERCRKKFTTRTQILAVADARAASIA